MPNPAKNKVVKDIKPRSIKPDPIDRSKLDLKQKGNVGHNPRKLEDLKNVLDSEKNKNINKNINLSNINKK
jgi:hypothetical protein